MSTIESLVVTVAIGGFVGWLASLLMKTRRQMGVLGFVVIGILGSILGHAVFGVLGFAAFSFPATLIVDVVGAVLLIAILRGLKIYR